MCVCACASPSHRIAANLIHPNPTTNDDDTNTTTRQLSQSSPIWFLSLHCDRRGILEPPLS